MVGVAKELLNPFVDEGHGDPKARITGFVLQRKACKFPEDFAKGQMSVNSLEKAPVGGLDGGAQGVQVASVFPLPDRRAVAGGQ